MTESLLARARSMTRDIRAASDDIEHLAALTPGVESKLFDAGMFDMLMPSDMGGLETPLPDYLDVIEQLAFGDGSVAWCVNQACVFATTLTKLPRFAAEKIYRPGATSIVHGPPEQTRAVRVDGGYRVTGRWSFGSGIGHSTWLAGVADIEGDPGTYLLVLFPKSDAAVIENWDVRGLTGTGSHDFAVDGLFVPNEHTVTIGAESFADGPIYLFPVVPLFAMGFASVALGVSVMMLDLILDMASGKTARHTRHKLMDDAHAQEQVGIARARWSAARYYLHGEVGSVWDDVTADGVLTMEQRVRLRLCSTHVLREARAVADMCWNIAGTSGIRAGAEFHRRYQDMIVISQHLQARTAYYPMVGKYTLGDTSHPGPLV